MFAARSVSLADVAGSRENNFNLIRMAAASGVLLSHAYPIALGAGTIEPLKAATNFTLGQICVALFFAISGFLITRSFDRKAHISAWLSARIMRLFPALLVVTTLTALLYGPVFTALPLSDYFASSGTWSYMPRNLSLAFLQYDLPGVFDANPYPRAINGSLWTLFHEVACYGFVFLAGIAGAIASRRFFLLLSAGYAVAYAATALPTVAELLPHRLEAFRALSFPFFLGAVFYVWRDMIRLSWPIALALPVVAAATRGTLLYAPLFHIALVYGVFVLAYRPRGIFLQYNRLGDYSYGMYIYAFPVQQAVIHLSGPMTPLENIAVALPVTLALAIVSWVMIEKPALAVRHRAADLMVRRWRRALPGAENPSILHHGPDRDTHLR